MPQPKDHYDPSATDPNFRQTYRGGYSRSEAGHNSGPTVKWVAGIVATVVGAIIIIQLQFFGSEVVEQGKAMARIEERMIHIQNAATDQGKQYAEFRRDIEGRISRIERGEIGRVAR